MLVDLPNDMMIGNRLSHGVYQARFSFGYLIDELTWDQDNMQHDYATGVLRLWINELAREDEYDPALYDPRIVQNAYENYGVCDHWSQILVKFPQLQTSVIPYIVRVSPVRKRDQDPSGGWRWHKWGPYIGAFQEQMRSHEYLYDTPDVKEVFTYEVHEMRYPWK